MLYKSQQYHRGLTGRAVPVIETIGPIAEKTQSSFGMLINKQPSLWQWSTTTGFKRMPISNAWIGPVFVLKHLRNLRSKQYLDASFPLRILNIILFLAISGKEVVTASESLNLSFGSSKICLGKQWWRVDGANVAILTKYLPPEQRRIVWYWLGQNSNLNSTLPIRIILWLSWICSDSSSLSLANQCDNECVWDQLCNKINYSGFLKTISKHGEHKAINISPFRFVNTHSIFLFSLPSLQLNPLTLRKNSQQEAPQ